MADFKVLRFRSAGFDDTEVLEIECDVEDDEAVRAAIKRADDYFFKRDYADLLREGIDDLADYAELI